MSLLLLIIAIIIAYVLYHQLYARGLNYPPGPRALPIVGHLVQLYTEETVPLLQQWGRRYGGVFTLWLGPTTPVVVITDYDILREAFVDNGDAFTGRPPKGGWDAFTKGNYGLAIGTGAMWREHRRFALHTLKDFGFSHSLMEDKINYDLEHMLEMIDGNVDKGEKVDMQGVMLHCVASVIANLVFGERYEYGDAHLRKVLELQDEVMATYDDTKVTMHEVEWLKHIPLFGHLGYDSMVDAELKFRKVFMELMDKQSERQKGLSGEADCYVQAYKEQRERYRVAGNEPLADMYSDWQLYMAAADMWIAGMDTTAHTLVWAVGLMCANPDIQDKVHKEIESVLGMNGRVTMADKARLPYVLACLTEIQRCANLVPMNLMHYTTEDVAVCGHLLKKDTRIQGSIACVMFDERHFPEPKVFKPERFYQTDERRNNADKVIPFSMGKRSCLGESLARMELFIVFTTLFQRYKIEFATEQDGHNFGIDKTEPSFFRKPAAYGVKIKKIAH